MNDLWKEGKTKEEGEREKEEGREEKERREEEKEGKWKPERGSGEGKGRGSENMHTSKGHLQIFVIHYI